MGKLFVWIITNLHKKFTPFSGGIVRFGAVANRVGKGEDGELPSSEASRYYQTQQQSSADTNMQNNSGSVVSHDIGSRLEYLNALSRGEQTLADDDASSEDSALEMVSVGSGNEDEISVDSEEMDDGLHRAKPLMDEAPKIDTDVERIDPTHRLAVVNCDWERMRSVDILATLRSFTPSSGTINKVEVYPSEYGLKKLAEEARYGPVTLWETHKMIKKTPVGESQEKTTTAKNTASQNHHNDDTLANDNEDEEIDPVVLRQYELNKLKYYYAIVHCDSAGTANSIYKECNGLEWEHSANTIDLRFIPDEFKPTHAEPRDTADDVPTNYEPPEFYTKALQASKVELSWDKDDDQRQQILRYEGTIPKEKRKKIKKHKKLRGQVDEDMEEDEILGRRLQDDAYESFIVDSDDAAQKEDEISSSEDDEGDQCNSKKADKEERRQKYRALLLGEDEEFTKKKLKDKKKKKKHQVNDNEEPEANGMEITFTPGMGDKVLENKKEREKREEETVWEAYLRKRKEKKRERRQNAKQSKASERVEETKAKQEILQNEAGSHINTQSVARDFEIPEDLQEVAEPGNDPFFSVVSEGSRNKEITDFKNSESFYHGKSVDDIEKQKEGRRKQKEQIRQQKQQEEEQRNREESKLGLLMMGEEDQSESDSEDEKRKKNKKDKKKKAVDETTLDTDMNAAKARGIISQNGKTEKLDAPEINAKDPRFAAALEKQEFQLDPTDPSYRDTVLTRTLIAEKQKRRRDARTAAPKQELAHGGDTQSMAESLRKKFSKKNRKTTK